MEKPIDKRAAHFAEFKTYLNMNLPTDIKWSIQRNKSSVIHSTELFGHHIEVRNYVGTRSMEGVVFRNGSEWFSVNADRKEWSVSSLKEECILLLLSRIK
jgi:hypothetical protein